jgi:hypothetical protein
MSLCQPTQSPDFKQIVDRTIAVFAVFTGATLSFYVKDFLFSDANLAKYHTLLDWAGYWGTWAVFAVIALLLRYIIGSAVHLNHAYVPKETQRVDGGRIMVEKTYVSRSLCLLYFDLLFIIVFGVLAVYITHATDSIDTFMLRSIYFVAGGLLWAVIALARTREREVAWQWIIIDVAQIVATWLLINLPWGELATSIILAAIYLLCLFADFWVMVRWRSA